MIKILLFLSAILLFIPNAFALAPPAQQVATWAEQKINNWQNAAKSENCNSETVTSAIIDHWKNMQGYQQAKREWRLLHYKNSCQINDIFHLKNLLAQMAQIGSKSNKSCTSNGVDEIKSSLTQMNFLIIWLQQIGDFSNDEEQRLYAERVHPINKWLDQSKQLEEIWHGFRFTTPTYYSEANCQDQQFELLSKTIKQLFHTIETASHISHTIEARLNSFFTSYQPGDVFEAAAQMQFNSENAWLNKNNSLAKNKTLSSGTPTGNNLFLMRDANDRNEELWRRYLTAELRSQPAFCPRLKELTQHWQRDYDLIKSCQDNSIILAEEERQARLAYQGLLLEGFEIDEQGGQLLDVTTVYTAPLTDTANQHWQKIYSLTEVIRANHQGF